jgi:hypothetical protein
LPPEAALGHRQRVLWPVMAAELVDQPLLQHGVGDRVLAFQLPEAIIDERQGAADVLAAALDEGVGEADQGIRIREVAPRDGFRLAHAVQPEQHEGDLVPELRLPVDGQQLLVIEAGVLAQHDLEAGHRPPAPAVGLFIPQPAIHHRPLRVGDGAGDGLRTVLGQIDPPGLEDVGMPDVVQGADQRRAGVIGEAIRLGQVCLGVETGRQALVAGDHDDRDLAFVIVEGEQPLAGLFGEGRVDGLRVGPAPRGDIALAKIQQGTQLRADTGGRMPFPGIDAGERGVRLPADHRRVDGLHIGRLVAGPCLGQWQLHEPLQVGMALDDALDQGDELVMAPFSEQVGQGRARREPRRVIDPRQEERDDVLAEAAARAGAGGGVGVLACLAATRQGGPHAVGLDIGALAERLDHGAAQHRLVNAPLAEIGAAAAEAAAVGLRPDVVLGQWRVAECLVRR